MVKRQKKPVSAQTAYDNNAAGKRSRWLRILTQTWWTRHFQNVRVIQLPIQKPWNRLVALPTLSNNKPYVSHAHKNQEFNHKHLKDLLEKSNVHKKLMFIGVHVYLMSRKMQFLPSLSCMSPFACLDKTAVNIAFDWLSNIWPSNHASRVFGSIFTHFLMRTASHN